MHEASSLSGDPNRGVRVCSSKYQEYAFGTPSDTSARLASPVERRARVATAARVLNHARFKVFRITHGEASCILRAGSTVERENNGAALAVTVRPAVASLEEAELEPLSDLQSLPVHADAAR